MTYSLIYIRLSLASSKSYNNFVLDWMVGGLEQPKIHRNNLLQTQNCDFKSLVIITKYITKPFMVSV
jgi:hypothetical protein